MCPDGEEENKWTGNAWLLFRLCRVITMCIFVTLLGTFVK